MSSEIPEQDFKGHERGESPSWKKHAMEIWSPCTELRNLNQSLRPWGLRVLLDCRKAGLWDELDTDDRMTLFGKPVHIQGFPAEGKEYRCVLGKVFRLGAEVGIGLAEMKTNATFLPALCPWTGRGRSHVNRFFEG